MGKELKRRSYDLSDYEITPEGTVINKHTGRILKQQFNDKGYLRFGIMTDKGRRMVLVHRIVAQLYVPNPDNKPQVNHIDGNKSNNKYDNLEWVTNQENRDHAMQHGLHHTGEQCSWSKLTKEDVIFIRNHPEMKSSELSKMFNVSVRTISDVRLYKSWKTIEKIC